MEEYKVTCDNCGLDITYTGNSMDWRISLSSEPKPLKPGVNVVTDMYIPRPIEKDMQFCSVSCLTNKFKDF